MEMEDPGKDEVHAGYFNLGAVAGNHAAQPVLGPVNRNHADVALTEQCLP